MQSFSEQLRQSVNPHLQLQQLQNPKLAKQVNIYDNEGWSVYPPLLRNQEGGGYSYSLHSVPGLYYILKNTIYLNILKINNFLN